MHCPQISSATRLFPKMLSSLVLPWGSAKECKAALLTWEIRTSGEKGTADLCSPACMVHGRFENPHVCQYVYAWSPSAAQLCTSFAVFTQPHNTCIPVLHGAGMFGPAPPSRLVGCRYRARRMNPPAPPQGGGEKHISGSSSTPE